MLDNTFAALWARLAEVRREDGQGMVEYALILVLVSIVAIAILQTVGQDVIGVFTDVVAGLGTR